MESSPGLFTLMSILTCTTLFLKQNTTDLLFPVMSFTYCKICNCIIVVYWHQRTWHVICHQLLNIESQHLENPHKYVVFYPLVLFFALSSLSHALLAALELSQSGSCVSCHYWSLCPISCYWSGVKHSCPKLMIIPAVEEQFWQTVQRSNTTIIIIMSFLADHQITFTRTEEHKHPNVKVVESQWSLDDRADSDNLRGRFSAELPFTHFLSHYVGGSLRAAAILLSLWGFSQSAHVMLPHKEPFCGRAQNYRPAEHNIITNHKALSTAGQPQLHSAPFPTPNTRAVYWQESGETIHITIQRLRYNILRYCKQCDTLGYFLF